MTRKLLLIIFVVSPFLLVAQQTPYFHFFQQNWTFVNPAAVDKSFIFEENNPFILHASYRQQWIGIEDAPRIYYAGFEHKPAGDENFKWGFQFFGDQSGTLNTFGGYFNYGYALRFGRYGSRRLHLGLNAGVLRYGIDQQQLELKDPDDPVAIDARGTVYSDISAGIFYQSGRNYYVGISVPQLFTLDLHNLNEEGSFTPEKIPHLYFVVGGFLGGGEKCRSCPSADFILEPSLWVKYTPGINYFSLADNLPVSVDLQIRGYFREILWVGAGYGTNQHLAIDFGVNKPLPAILGDTNDKLRIGVGYNVPFQATGLDLGHSVEVNVAYSWH